MLPKSVRFLLLTGFFLGFFLVVTTASAQTPSASPAPSQSPVNPFFNLTQQVPAYPSYAPIDAPVAPPGTTWQYDKEVTVVGKSAVRSLNFLDWTLLHAYVPRGGYAPIVAVWKKVQLATFAFAALIIVAVGFMLMLRQKKDITVMKFLPLFIGLMIYVFLSFAIVQAIYQLNESLSRSFLMVDKVSGQKGFITSEDLLSVAFPYQTYHGERRAGPDYDESALISLLLARLTVFTYMSMSGILIVRQIILWFFIIISPFLAFLIPFPLVRNTAKIWIGEFFRWLFYGLLFSMFLRGLVIMWRMGIPMGFAADNPPGSLGVVYPTSVRFLLAGPNYQALTSVPDKTSINTIDAYANYVVALIMLWVVILLPWVLLRIFRDMFNTWIKSENGNHLFGQLTSFYNRFIPGTNQAPTLSPAPPSEPPKSPSPAGTGRALELPFRKVNIVARDVSVNNKNTITMDKQVTQAATQELAKLIGASLPKMTDIARMEMNKNSMTQAWNNLAKVGNPNLAVNAQEVQKVASIRSELTRRAQAGDESARTMLSAAQSAAAVSAQASVGTTVVSSANHAAAAIAAAAASAPNAAKIVAQARVGNMSAGRIIPVVNRVQSVSLEDYEEVKKMWLEHYNTSDVPAGTNAKDKKEWIKQDIEKAETAISMLGNINPEIKQKGLEMVAVLLPFLLLGGFSEQETIAYLKAKTEAAKQVLEQMEKEEQHNKAAQEKDEEESLEIATNKQSAKKEAHLMAEVADETVQEPKPENTPNPATLSPQEEAKLEQAIAQAELVNGEAIENKGVPLDMSLPTDEKNT